MRAAADRTLPRLDPGGPGLRVLVVAGLLAASAAGFLAWRSRPEAEPVAAPPIPAGVAPSLVSPASPLTPAGPSSPPSAVSRVVVYVSGKVRRPGVLTLAAGSRVVDAIQAAGGVRAGADPGGVNLARRLVDGEQIAVGGRGQATVGAQGGAAVPGAGEPLNLNTATVEQLDTLPGVGEVLAQRIVGYRDAHGGFASVDQLGDVSGIGARRLEELRDKVVV
ncbi:ComEA family DNA-binding protein [Microbispora sp. RL4-1S]|uniref:ComEA family DNA-binding protein n=1 Tax=Microbispora oryzae TaxID=2806554 RepID=A0A941AHH1_9ACTN|nr:ComEA family DNA-binding protein [Microbispora oryzae]